MSASLQPAPASLGAARHLPAAAPHWLDWAAPLAAMALHLLAVALAWGLWGLRVDADPQRATWDYFWQTLPAEQLRGNLAQALLYLHTQPPLFNLWGALFLRTAGDGALAALAWANVALGTLVAGMHYAIGRALGLPRAFAAVAALLLALSASLLLYEFYPLYEVLSLFWLTLALWCFARRTLGGSEGWLLCGVAALVALSLTRTSFHLLLPLAAAGLAAFAAQRRRRTLLLGLLLCAPLLLWSGKNALLFGFFGAGSWGGMNIWRVASAPYDAEELAALAESGVISRMAAEVEAFSLPATYRPYGFTAASDVPALQVEDFGNLAMIDVAAQFGRDARALLLHNPARALGTVAAAYARFNRPPATYDHLEANRSRLPSAWLAADELLVARPWLARFGSITAFLLPLALLLFLIWAAARVRQGEAPAGFVRSEPAALLAAGLLLYTALVSSLFELGENERFRFVVEALLLLFLAGMLANLLRLRRAPMSHLPTHLPHTPQATP